MEKNLESVSLVWANRAHAEIGAYKKFRKIAEDLLKINYLKNYSIIFNQMALEEYSHFKKCKDISLELGHETGVYSQLKKIDSNLPNWRNNLDEEKLVIGNIIQMCCLTESFNASLLNSIFNNSKKNKYQKLIKEILKDEIKHGQIGWSFLNHICKNKNLNWSQKLIPLMLQEIINEDLFNSSFSKEDDLHLINYGVLPEKYRISQFMQTLNETIIPGFKNFGFKIDQIDFETSFNSSLAFI